MSRTWIALALALAAAGARAACSAQAGAEHPHLVELYTSEGCDSCPPAERWMSTLRRHADLIGLEYHVDYWDTVDWRDPFSNHAYTLRQQALADRGNRGQLFTPQIWLDGRLWANWPKATPPEPVTAPAPPLRIEAAGADALQLRIDLAGTPADAYRVYAAISEDGLSEHVRGGENRGKTLSHDEVVRAFAGPLAPPHAELALDVPARVDADKAALVAFVQDTKNGDIVQAVRIPLSECRK